VGQGREVLGCEPGLIGKTMDRRHEGSDSIVVPFIANLEKQTREMHVILLPIISEMSETGQGL
jgi:hypothetical protein